VEPAPVALLDFFEIKPFLLSLENSLEKQSKEGDVFTLKLIVGKFRF